MATNKWFKEHPEKAREIQRRYYKKNLLEAKKRSRMQNIRGKYSWQLLSDEQKSVVLSRIKEATSTDVKNHNGDSNAEKN